jgi:hypothetical protein
LDYGAAEILLALAPSPRTMGRTVSVLLHQEWTRLEERASVTAAQAQTSSDQLHAKPGKAAREVVTHA